MRVTHRRPVLLPSLLILVAMLLASTAGAAELRGRVIGITEGDTLTVLTDGERQVRVRLAGIDAPEPRQPYGRRAWQELAGLAFSQKVRVVVRDTDRYRRSVGQVFVGALDVNAEMVRRGAAWVFRGRADDPALLRLEAEARDAGRGLWALPEAERIPPWEWRAAQRRR